MSEKIRKHAGAMKAERIYKKHIQMVLDPNHRA
jgi:hypothetical protein